MSMAPPHILIVDDEPDICLNMADIFTDLGYRVDIANDGVSALALVQKRRYDLALLDLMMPGMDGATLYEEIKKVRAGTVAVLITAYPGHPRAEAAVASGAWKVLPKPVALPRLIELIEEAQGQPLLLVVDDDADFCANLWDLLRERGYRVCLVHDIATATKAINEDEGYKLVLLDMKLPDGDGSEVVRTVRQKDPAIPVVVVTGYHHEIEPQIPELVSEGAKAVLSKPLEMPALLAMLQKLTREEHA
jgi:CheY-like chemotaxis protein